MSENLNKVTIDIDEEKYINMWHQVSALQMQNNELQSKLDKAVEALKYFDQVLRVKKTFKMEELEYKAFIELKELGVE